MIYFSFRDHVTSFSLLGVKGQGEFLVTVPDFLLVFYYNIPSIVYRFQVISNNLKQKLMF
jgi:hypothetical protein